ncbi:MAG TPA: hypothetical protein VGP48_06700 [Stellaceae bacterium]|jgi:hypothetical protein|nr:hypothetical protein [Stellaceae bacterium]
MSGTSPVSAWALPFSTGTSVDDPTSYKGKIDGDFAVVQRVADAFAPKPASPAAMSVAIDPGFVVATGPSGLQSIVELGVQSVTIAAAPGAPNNRIDLVVIDDGTGIASVIAGAPAGTPAAPALTPGKKQIAQIAVPNGTSAIANANITDLRAVWQSTVPGIKWAIAGGSADAITASYTPANAALADGLVLGFRASAANATTTPSFSPDGLTAATITKKGGQALLAGDIPGALGECLLRYNAANTRWELLNPAVALPTIANDHLLANTSGATAAPVDTALSALIDAAAGNTNADMLQRVSGAWIGVTLSGAIDNAIGATRGAILERGASGWTLVAPGTSGQVLTSNGSGADPSYQGVTGPTSQGAVGTYVCAYGSAFSVPSGGYQWSGSTPAIGATGTIVGLSGTWRNMSIASQFAAGTSCCAVTGLTYLALRIA